ncbi:hypothetical protein [Candidatus Liberibacter americanus]|uniref:Acetyltransferase n=1 Tax=Candidatus Liberibacter americanus str. Sao Paulo TaxID=1261131 RepID=U6B5D4_9HYPH|nr:hypothetical protein [Candidatus Liberibacter americanus]AHA27858.1 Acetyltransferase [Candidatus Liberibacter americanus str. Sao Paulo]EMS35903.1 hypothetical protein G653_04236 [Candidatus Liberibacter americanus PW_SP]
MDIIWGGVKTPAINQAIANFVGKRIKNCAEGWNNFVSIGFLENNLLLAGVIYHNYCPIANVIELSGASDTKHWLTRKSLKEIYNYPWNELNCQAVVQRVPDEDFAQHRMLAFLGAIRYHIPRLRGRDAAENIYVMTHESWMNNKINK